MSFYDELIPGFGGRCWQVHKFGGTSVANANCFLQVAKILEDQLDIPAESSATKHLAVVVSAMGGRPKVTDLLLDAVRHSSTREHDRAEEALGVVLEKHRECLDVLFRHEECDGERERLLDIIEGGLNDIRDILKTVSLMKWQAERISEVVSGYGELWSSQILTCVVVIGVMIVIFAASLHVHLRLNRHSPN